MYYMKTLKKWKLLANHLSENKIVHSIYNVYYLEYNGGTVVCYFSQIWPFGKYWSLDP